MTNNTPLHQKIAFVGAGTIAFALAKGFTASARVMPSELHMLVRNAVKRDLVIESGYVPLHNAEELTSMDVIFLSLGAEEALEFLRVLGPQLEHSKQLLVSLAMGLSLQRIDAAIASARANKGLSRNEGCFRVARLIPNVACQSGSGVSVFCLGEDCTHEDGMLLMALLTTCGVSYRVQENHMEACAAISASGPAYIFTMLEALSDAGVKNGLTRSLAAQLAIDMMEGSARLASKKAESTTLGELKQEVVSPAGSTIMGLAMLEEFGFKNATMKAVEEALVPAEPDVKLL